jgi:hypothetical protein
MWESSQEQGLMDNNITHTQNRYYKAKNKASSLGAYCWVYLVYLCYPLFGMIQNDPQMVGYWDGLLGIPHEVLLPTIFDASELRSDFNGKVMRGSVATMGGTESHHFL